MSFDAKGLPRMTLQSGICAVSMSVLRIHLIAVGNIIFLMKQVYSALQHSPR